MNTILDIFKDRIIDFAFYRNKVNIGYHWLRLLPSDVVETYKVQALIDIDLTSYGLPESITRRSDIIYSNEGKPIRYLSIGTRGDIQIETKDNLVAKIQVDGKNMTRDISDCSFFYESNFVGLEWIFFALHCDNSTKVETWFFDINKMEKSPYILEKINDNVWKTNLGSEIRASNNFILEFTYPQLGLNVTRERAPKPNWDRVISKAASPNLIYHVPANAKFIVDETSIRIGNQTRKAIYRIPKNMAPPFPVVLFISGSGSQDRHGFSGSIDLGTHVILDHIANSGFAVLSVDDQPIEDLNDDNKVGVGLVDLVSDMQTVLNELANNKELDSNGIFLLGHSEGAVISMMLAKANRLAGIALMAPPCRPIDVIMHEQIESALRRANFTSKQIEIQLSKFETLVAKVKEDNPIKEDNLVPQVNLKTIKWLKEHIEHPASSLVQHVSCPVAIFQGDKDFQVNFTQDGQRLAELLRESGNEKVSVYLFKDVDHLFRVEPYESEPIRYYDSSRPISIAFLKKLTDWLSFVIST
jgi:pimeloyl-ACP methyl ester carboxylesterase